MTEPSKRDPLAIGIAAISLVVQLGMGLYWYGRLAERVDGIEKQIASQDIRVDAATVRISADERDVAVLSVKLDDIKASLESINHKLDKGR